MRDREQETREELLRYLEEVSGHSLRTREDVDRFLAFYEEVHPHHELRAPAGIDWLTAKRVVLIGMLALATFQYFAVDIVTEVISTENVRFLAPPPVKHTART